MRAWVFRGILTLALIASTAAGSSASTLALDVTSGTQIFAPGVFRNIGWQFSVNTSVTVDGLGVFDVDAPGFAERHQVGLWDNSGNLLAQAVVWDTSALVLSASTAGDWRFENIAPLVLGPGTYVVGAFYSDSSDPVMANATLALAPQISFLASRASQEVAFAMPGVYGLVEPGVFAANVRINAVPEPASMLLLGSGLAALVARRRRSRR
jgi:hypothetical protein